MIFYLNINTATVYATSFNSVPNIRISVFIPGHHLQFPCQCPNIPGTEARIQSLTFNSICAVHK